MKRRFLLLAAALILLSPVHGMAQQVSIKTNLLYDATATVNLGIEYVAAPRWSLDLSGNFNSWAFSEARWKHWMVQPEARYWFCDATAGHFLGLHILGGQCNVGHIDVGDLNLLGTDFSRLKDHRYQGWFAGAGAAYGYSWILGEHFNIEAEVGAGWIFTRYDIYECAGCGRREASGLKHNYFGPTKAALNLVYIF